MSWLVSLAGVVVVAWVLIQQFHTVWHPQGRGRLSAWVFGAVWWVAGRRGRRSGSSAMGGPVSLVLVVLTWAVLSVLGWALVYWPHVPEAFSYSAGLLPAARSDLLDAVYVSAVALTTLGFGDVVPTAGWLRLIVPLQALTGFALLTASVSWGLQLQSAMTRRRVLALRLHVLISAGAREQLPAADSAATATLLYDLATGVTESRIDLTQYAETYYFRDTEADTSLAATVGDAQRLARLGSASARRDVQVAGQVLGAALDDLARQLDASFLGTGGDTDEVLARFAAAHGHDPGAR